MNVWRVLHVAALITPLGLAMADLMSWTLSGVGVGLAALAWFLESRAESKSTDTWEGIVVLETVAVVVALSGLGLVAQCGFVAAAPFMARRRHLAHVGPRSGYLAGLVVLFGGWSGANGWVPGVIECVQAAAVAASAYWFWKAGQEAVVVERVAVPAAFAPLSQVTAYSPALAVVDDRYETLRESYRKLRSTHDELTRNTEYHRAVVALARWRFDDEQTIGSLARTLRELAGVEGVAVYNIPDARDGVALVGCAGTAPSEARMLRINLHNSPVLIREAAERDLRTAAGRKGELTTLLLTERGRLAGLVALVDQDPNSLERGRAIIDTVATLIARLLRDDKEAQHQRERLAQAELLNLFSSRKPAANANDTARLLASDIATELGLTGCAVFDLTGPSPALLGGIGEHAVEVLNFTAGPGLFGWTVAGAHEAVVDEARDHPNCDGALAVRKGIGSLFVQPLISSGSLVGALVSWTASGHGISSVVLSTLRSLTPHVLRQVFGGFSSTASGLVDADTFRHVTQGPGSFVEIDLGSDPSGTADRALTEARRRLLTAAMGRLPQGGVLTRREAGTIMAFLPGVDDSAAARWASKLGEVADMKWGMRVDCRGESQQSSQVFVAKAS